MTTNEEIREVSALIKAKESEISRRQIYLANTSRYEAELKAEELKLKYQQERVDRLRAIKEDGEEGVHRYYLEIEDLRRKLKLLKNKDAVDRFLKVQAQFNKLTADEQERLAAAVGSAVEPEPATA